MAKKTIKLRDLQPVKRPVDISEEEQIEVRALTLSEVITLFLEAKTEFLAFYAIAMGDKSEKAEAYTPLLMAAPDFVAKVIAVASDDPEAATVVKTKAGTMVQLIALMEIGKASVPDAKKAQDLLSEVMGLLQQLHAASGKAEATSKTTSPTELPKA